MRIRIFARGSAIAALSAAAAIAMAVSATAAPDGATVPGGSASVDTEVDISSPGELYMLVEPGSIKLTEQGSDTSVRRFVGALPGVTVVDTRADDEVTSSVWYVTGTASAFTAPGLAPIAPTNIGWSPSLADDYDGVVSPGFDVFPVIDTAEAPNNVGLVGEELLFITEDPITNAVPGEYKAGADVFLHVPASVAGGLYTGTLTLSLYED